MEVPHAEAAHTPGNVDENGNAADQQTGLM